MSDSSIDRMLDNYFLLQVLLPIRCVTGRVNDTKRLGVYAICGSYWLNALGVKPQ
ncbi:hypothetical protein PspTeo4_46904 (plasmid) [Pseudomonas sp. Teo4]|nr:hypothetical protein [Pseudomonas sp. Teo4]